MSPILAVMLVVTCEPDLVHCAPVTHWKAIWRTVEDCRRDRPRVAERVRREQAPQKAVMTACRLFVDEDGTLRATLPRRDSDPLTGALY